MKSVEELLAPISAGLPCGVDIGYDPALQTLETLLQGKPEAQYGETITAAQEPVWKDIEARCLDLLSRSKEMRVIVILALALLKREGLAGFRDGLALLSGSLERYWEDLYPRLDPEENNDPTQRVNILSALFTPLGTFGDPYRFAERLNEARLFEAPGIGWISMADINRATDPATRESATPKLAQIQAGLRASDAGSLKTTADAVSESITLVGAMDDFLTKTLGASVAPDSALLSDLLREINKNITVQMPESATNTAGGKTTSPARAGTPLEAGSPGVPYSGAVQTRQDVLAAMEEICSYYSRNEPSSPVPFLLRRAQRLAEMDFMQIVNELSPEALAQLRHITGGAGETGQAAETDTPAA